MKYMQCVTPDSDETKQESARVSWKFRQELFVSFKEKKY